AAIQLLWPRAPPWRTSARCEVPLECPLPECRDEPEMATPRHGARGERGLRFYAARRSRTGKASRTSAAPFEDPFRLRIAASLLRSVQAKRHTRTGCS